MTNPGYPSLKLIRYCQRADHNRDIEQAENEVEGSSETGGDPGRIVFGELGEDRAQTGS